LKPLLYFIFCLELLAQDPIQRVKALDEKAYKNMLLKRSNYYPKSGFIKVYDFNNNFLFTHNVPYLEEVLGKNSIYLSQSKLSQKRQLFFAHSATSTQMQNYFDNAYLIGFKPDNIASNPWQALNYISLRLKYALDDKTFVDNEIWQTSKEAYYRLRGDCEDHAILLADWLIELGYDARVVAGKHKNEGHAWVVLIYKNKEYVLEATSKRQSRILPLALALPDYHPSYMFNRKYTWINTGSTLTVNYRNQNWHRVSEFVGTD